MKYKYFAFAVILLFAFSLKVNAGIVYTNAQDSTTVLPDTAGLVNYYSCDLNNDGVYDFNIGISNSHEWRIPHPPGNDYIVFFEGSDTAKISTGPFFINDQIDENLNYYSHSRIYGYTSLGGPEGTWYYDTPADTFAYIGIELTINNLKYYGWVKLKANEYHFTISEFAFNNVANQSITAGVTQ